MNRAQRAAEAARLKALGLNGIQVAERMGISRSYAYELLNDPEGHLVRKRKAGYGGRCEGCGAPTSYSSLGPPSRLCVSCAADESTIWTRDAVVFAVQEWVDRYGDIPSAEDWNPAMIRNPGRRAVAEERYRDRGWPPYTAVRRTFGGIREAVRAAGFTPRESGHRGPDRPETVRALAA